MLLARLLDAEVVRFNLSENLSSVVPGGAPRREGDLGLRVLLPIGVEELPDMRHSKCESLSAISCSIRLSWLAK